MQCEIAAAYMSGNLRHTKQLISELTVPTMGHPLRPDALAVEARVCDRTVVPQRGEHDAVISIAVKRVTAKTS